MSRIYKIMRSIQFFKKRPNYNPNTPNYNKISYKKDKT